MSAHPLRTPQDHVEPQGIGDITLAPGVVSTPSGRSSIGQVEWQIDDASNPPRWSRANRDRDRLGDADEVEVVGAVRVTATGPGWQHVTAVPVATLEDVTAIYAKVLHARRLDRRRRPQECEPTGSSSSRARASRPAARISATTQASRGLARTSTPATSSATPTRTWSTRRRSPADRSAS